MSRLPARILCGLGVVGAVGCGPAFAQRLDLVPFVDIRQTGSGKISGNGDDFVTYTDFVVGLGAQTNTRRIVATVNYSLDYRVGEAGQSERSVYHNGAARGQILILDDNALSLDVGALATQSRVDPGGSAPQFQSVQDKNLTQTYSFFVSPSTVHHFGDLDMRANYRFGYTKNDGTSTFTLGQPPVNRFSSSTTQLATAQIGMGIGTLPFEWTLAAQGQLENSDQLDQRFKNYSAVGDITLPIAGAVALVASAGYEASQQTQAAILRDLVTGLPVTDGNGGFIVDPSQPRKLIYDTSGMIGDAGLVWRPTHRTRVEARVGRRYGGLTYTGLVEMKPNEKSNLTVAVTDRLSSFAQGVTSGLASAPLLFQEGSNDPATGLQTCLFGKTGNGSCLGGALGQASASRYRDRAVNIVFNYVLRRTTLSLTGGYSRRTYIDDPTNPFSLNGVVDRLIFFSGSANRTLTRDSTISFAFSGNLFKNGLVGVSDVSSYSINMVYNRTMGRGLQAQANLGLESTKQDGSAADISGRAQLGLHYGF